MSSKQEIEILRAALSAGDPLRALEAAVVGMKERGASKKRAYALLSDLREAVKIEGDETKEAAVLAVMDFVYGFCTPDRRIWPADESAT